MSAQTKICPKCGSLNPITAQICSVCQHQFRTQFAPPDQTVAFPAAQQQPQQPYSPQYQPQMDFPRSQSTGKEGLAIASLVLGILAVLSMCVPIVAFLPGVLGIIFGAIGLRSFQRGMAIAGLVCSLSSLGVAAWINFTIMGAAFQASAMQRAKQQEPPTPPPSSFR